MSLACWLHLHNPVWQKYVAVVQDDERLRETLGKPVAKSVLLITIAVARSVWTKLSTT